MKSLLRQRLRNLQKYVKITVLAEEFGISKVNLSRFLKGPEYDYYLSVDKLEALVDYIENTLASL